MKLILIRMAQSLIFILVSAWVILGLLLYIFQPEFVYYPAGKIVATPANAGLSFEDIILTTPDQVKIHGWYVPHEHPRATLLFLHGNGGNISHRIEKLSIYNQLGLSVFIIDYHGYGTSGGSPSEKTTYMDAKSAWEYLTHDRGIPEKQIIIYGESMGSAVATWLASHVTAGALIIESAFTSIQSMGKHYYPYLPVKLLARIKYPVIDYIKKVHCPVLVIHSPQDEIVPYQQGRELYETANIPKSFLEITGDHNGGFYESGNIYKEGWDRFISTYFGPPTGQ